MSQDQIPVHSQPKKRGWRRGCLITLGVLALLAVPFVWFNLSTPLRVSKETTYVLGPMTADGKRIDYFRAMEERLYPPEMKTDDNGYRLIVRACGDMVKRTEGCCEDERELDCAGLLRKQVYEKLGLDPNEKPTLKKVECLYAHLHKYDEENPPAEGEKTQQEKYRYATFWTFDDFPMLKEWLDENTDVIDLITEAVRKPVFRIPYVRENENTPIFDVVLSGEVQMMRVWARSAQERANYRLGIGDIDGAIDDIITIHLIGRHSGKQGTLVYSLMGIAVEGMGRAIGIGSNPEFPPTKEQIERLVREMDALPPRATLNEVMLSERLFGLAAMQDIYWGNVGDPPLDPFWDRSPLEKMLPHMGWTMDINIALTRLNKVHDSLVIPGATIEGKTIEEVMEQSRSWNPLPLFSVRSRTNRIMNSMMALFIPAMQAAREAWRRVECDENMQRLTLALLLYEKEHDTLPDGDWREAIQPYLAPHPNPLPAGEGKKVTVANFRCPSHRGLAEDETTYAMIGNVPNPVASPNQILLVEVTQPQKLGEGDGRIPLGKADFENALGSNHSGGMNVGMRSGAVRFIAKTIKPEVWQSLLDGTAESLP
jgi:hypothetical protein